ncbi:hypothetical protein [Nocardia vulneris]|uniref:hypothetical protein n=1 Tax=Nocardia vulneris TaxID=1141657 RepID=UPI000B1B96FF|nr:hypothetical protein [Nocardia vulneris]
MGIFRRRRRRRSTARQTARETVTDMGQEVAVEYATAGGFRLLRAIASGIANLFN